jgi:hypothetical protein
MTKIHRKSIETPFKELQARELDLDLSTVNGGTN